MRYALFTHPFLANCFFAAGWHVAPETELIACCAHYPFCCCTAPTFPVPASAAAPNSPSAELDTIAVAIMEATAQEAPARAAPPASKRVVRSLPREALTEARLAELGGPGVKCLVCQDELAAGEEVQVLPCNHVFHPPCLEPWLLEHNNSCPTCRWVVGVGERRLHPLLCFKPHYGQR